MKRVNFLAMLLAAGMFAACSDNLDDTGSGGVGGMVCDGEGPTSLFSKPLPPTPGSDKHERRAKKGKQQQGVTLAPPPSLLDISSPMKVHHEIHVTIDPNSGKFTVCSYLLSLFFSLC